MKNHHVYEEECLCNNYGKYFMSNSYINIFIRVIKNSVRCRQLNDFTREKVR